MGITSQDSISRDLPGRVCLGECAGACSKVWVVLYLEDGAFPAPKKAVENNIKSSTPDQDLLAFSIPSFKKSFFDDLKQEYKITDRLLSTPPIMGKAENWRERQTKFQKEDPLLCKICKTVMVFVSAYSPNPLSSIKESYQILFT